MQINRKLLPVKAHYFFFMASMGPVLPQLPVYGRALGVPAEVMGAVTGVLPLAFLLAKPAFGFLADRFRAHRKHIFLGLVVAMGLAFGGLYFVPPPPLALHAAANITADIRTCNVTESQAAACVLATPRFWAFVLCMGAGTIAFNVVNSISDAVCFDVLGDGEQLSYGRQRVWGTLGFGVSALLAGVAVDASAPGDVKSFTPALLLMLAFLVADLFCCHKLQLPAMESPKSIVRDIAALLKELHIRIFIVFAALAGIVDSFVVYFFFWYLEELAAETGYVAHVKLLEGVIVAAETLCGEVLFFSVSGSILRAIGYGHALSVCFACYALRLALISAVPSPWWVVPVELLLQGPTYAMCYTTIVAYASAVTPPGASATMQGLVAGIDDGLGYALGSVLGGLVFRAAGGRAALQAFAGLALACAVAHAALYRTVLRHRADGLAPPPGPDVLYHQPPAVDTDT